MKYRMKYRKTDIMRSAVLLCDLERFYIKYNNMHIKSPIIMEEVHFPSFVNGMYGYCIKQMTNNVPSIRLYELVGFRSEVWT